MLLDYHVAMLTELFEYPHNMITSFLRTSDPSLGKEEDGCLVFYDLFSEVKHGLCYIYLLEVNY